MKVIFMIIMITIINLKIHHFNFIVIMNLKQIYYKHHYQHLNYYFFNIVYLHHELLIQIL